MTSSWNRRAELCCAAGRSLVSGSNTTQLGCKKLKTFRALICHLCQTSPTIVHSREHLGSSFIIEAAIRWALLTLVSPPSLCHLHDVFRNLNLSDVVRPFFASIYENIVILGVHRIGHEFQSSSIKFDFLFLCIPVTPYSFAEFLRVGHGRSLSTQKANLGAESPPYGESPA